MNIDEIRLALQDRRLNLIAKATGLNRLTLAKIRDGVTQYPSHETFLLIEDYLKSAPIESKPSTKEA